jgi:uncharacterized protein
VTELEEAPLLELFYRLRAAGMPIGITEYRLALESLHLGFGTANREALRRLCRMLWVTSQEEEQLLNYHFEIAVPLESKVIQPVQDLPTAQAKPAEPTPTPEADVRADPGDLSSGGSSTRPSDVEVALRTEDEVQAARTVRVAESEATRSLQAVTGGEYFPVTRRQMKQGWRYLRQSVRSGPLRELDVEATVRRAAREGALLVPVLVPRRSNRAGLVLLLDWDGSAVPFHGLSRRLAETAIRGGRLGQTDVYYFHNCPVEHVYRDPGMQHAELLEDVLTRSSPFTRSMLIFSDAGAARGGFNRERLELTQMFLEQLMRHIRRVSWVNPMPRSRWPGTTAAAIARLIPMCELSRRGLDEAVEILRGRQPRVPRLTQ